MVEDQLSAALVRLGLCRPNDRPAFEPLIGGVSSDIWRVEVGGRTFCVKRALDKLRVAADWRAPIERNAFEAEWMRVAGRIVPEAVPELLGQDETGGLLAMAYLPPEQYHLWKDQLRQAVAEPTVAAAVGERLGRIHAETAADPSVPARFATDEIFFDIRLEPYLVATARAHPNCASTLLGLVETTRATRFALIHGDVSPKNILVGPKGPVFLDAECAWFGDPAFDLAFCLNHLLLKGLWVPAAKDAFSSCFEALADVYLSAVDWEPPAALEARAAALLPGLLLGRVDGKSPVEYLTEARDKDHVRRVATSLLLKPADRLAAVCAAW